MKRCRKLAKLQSMLQQALDGCDLNKVTNTGDGNNTLTAVVSLLSYKACFSKL